MSVPELSIPEAVESRRPNLGSSHAVAAPASGAIKPSGGGVRSGASRYGSGALYSGGGAGMGPSFRASRRAEIEKRDADMRRRLQPYMAKKEADETIAAARAASRAAIRAQLEAKKSEALDRRLHGAEASRRTRPNSAPASRKPRAAASSCRPTTVLATPVQAAGGAAGSLGAGAAGAAGGESSKPAIKAGAQGGGGGGGEDVKELEKLESMFGDVAASTASRSMAIVAARPSETDMTLPGALRVPWGGNAQRYYEATIPDRCRPQPHLKPWNSTPHRNVPYGCRGIRLASEREMPWGKSARKAWEHSETCGLGFATAGLRKVPDDAREHADFSTDSIAKLHHRRNAEDRKYADATGRPQWDFTPWHSVPPALRGLTPITREPWLSDLQTYMQHEHSRRAGRVEGMHMYQAHEALSYTEQATQPALLKEPVWEAGLEASGGLAGGDQPKVDATGRPRPARAAQRQPQRQPQRVRPGAAGGELISLDLVAPASGAAPAAVASSSAELHA